MGQTFRDSESRTSKNGGNTIIILENLFYMQNRFQLITITLIIITNQYDQLTSILIRKNQDLISKDQYSKKNLIINKFCIYFLGYPE